MRQILIPVARAKLLNQDDMLKKVSERLSCKITIENDNEVVIEGDPYNEYLATNVIEAFGRGFDIDTAYRLLSDDIYFKSINLKEIFKNKKQIRRIKARIIGKNGKTKRYIQAVSGATLELYGGTVSGIGTLDQLKIAYTAIDILIEGGTHKKAYRAIEKARRELAMRG